MSKITNDGLTRSGTRCFIAVLMATVGVKGLNCLWYRIVIEFEKDLSHPFSHLPPFP